MDAKYLIQYKTGKKVEQKSRPETWDPGTWDPRP